MVTIIRAFTISDQAVGTAGRVVAGTPRDSLHLIDLIYSQDGGRRPEVVVTDTGSYSDIVFGLLTLLGFDYRPALADLPDARLWRTDPAADYGPLNPAARGKHRPRSRRRALARHPCAWSPRSTPPPWPRKTSIRVLSRGGNLTQLGEAIAHYGRIFKTSMPSR